MIMTMCNLHSFIWFFSLSSGPGKNISYQAKRCTISHAAHDELLCQVGYCACSRTSHSAEKTNGFSARTSTIALVALLICNFIVLWRQIAGRSHSIHGARNVRSLSNSDKTSNSRICSIRPCKSRVEERGGPLCTYSLSNSL